jgi:hypothetical protein
MRTDCAHTPWGYQIVCCIFTGVWRSLVAHLHGVQGVASSNLATPTKIKPWWWNW